jgi:spore photoproduct lyase
MCLYCYLVCTYYKSAYLRVFVNREAMMDKLVRAADKFPGSVFEIGSNSDLVLENSVSGNLEGTIRRFRNVPHARLTLPTKFDMVDPLLPLDHGGNVTIRMSLNPQEIIRRVEFGTSGLRERIADVGILVAPVILLGGYEALYEQLFRTMAEELDPELIRGVPVEIIFMTYGMVTKNINEQAFPNAVQLYDACTMGFCGRARYGYKPEVKQRVSEFLRDRIARYLPEAKIAYIV